MVQAENASVNNLRSTRYYLTALSLVIPALESWGFSEKCDFLNLYVRGDSP